MISVVNKRFHTSLGGAVYGTSVWGVSRGLLITQPGRAFGDTRKRLWNGRSFLVCCRSADSPIRKNFAPFQDSWRTSRLIRELLSVEALSSCQAADAPRRV